MRRRFQDLVQEYQHRIYTYACYCIGDQEEAQDITQEVLLKLWRNWQKLDSTGVWPWLIRVTRNASIDALRKRGSYRAVVEADPEGERTARTESGNPSPHADVETEEFQRHLTEALQRLAEPYRSIVILREIESFKYEEISSALELPLTRVKVYLHRGRRMLREQMREYVEHDSE